MNKKVAAKIERAILDRQTAKDALASRIDAAKAEITKAQNDATAATAGDNENDYLNAADRKRFNESIINTCEQKLKALSSETEFNRLVDEIKTEAFSNIDKTEQAAAANIGELFALCRNAADEITQANAYIIQAAAATGRDSFGATIYWDESKHELLFLKRIIEQRKKHADCNKSTNVYSQVNDK